MNNIVATYHRDCPDGTTAAACLVAKYPEAKVFPLLHSHTHEELQEVLAVVDATTDAYTLDSTIGAPELLAKARSLTIVDHHVSAKDEIAAITAEHPDVKVVFDLERSGAGLAWRHFHPTTQVPELIDLIEDTDLWKWKYGDRSRFASIFVGTMLNQPKKVAELFEADIDMVIARGTDMAVYEDGLIKRYLQKAEPVWVMLNGTKVPLYNTPNFDSYIGNTMSDKHGSVSGVFDIRGDMVRLSFRSKEGQNPKALDIAKPLGGGGHPHAAGASMTREEFLKHLC